MYTGLAETDQGDTEPPVLKKCKMCPLRSNENSNKLLYFYLVNNYEKEFHGLYKACDIKSELIYNRDLEGI